MGDRYRENKPFLRLKSEMGSEDVHYSIFYEGIPDEFKIFALKELNETEENKMMGLFKLRDFLKRKGISSVDDHILITVLRNCKYNIKKSEIKLVKYLKTQDLVTKWLQTTDLKKIELILNHRVIGFLPYRDKHGRVILYTTPYDLDFGQYDVNEVAFCSLCVLLYILSFPLTTIAGIAYIGECKSSSLSIFYPIVKGYRSHLPTILTFPYRIAKIDIINENFIIRWGFNLIRPLLPSKVHHRVQFHGSDLQSLHNTYNPAILPEDFGGISKSIDPKAFMDDVLNFTRKLKSRNLFLKQ